VDALDTENSNLKKEFSDSDSDDSITNEWFPFPFLSPQSQSNLYSDVQSHLYFNTHT
jgi:hypothetical protein